MRSTAGLLLAVAASLAACVPDLEPAPGTDDVGVDAGGLDELAGDEAVDEAIDEPAPGAGVIARDTIPPVVTITSAFTTTSDLTPTFTFVTAGGAVGTSCRIDAAAFAPCTSPYTTAPLSEGAHTFQVRAVDAAGNVGQASVTFVVDSVAPVVTITAGPTSTADRTPTFWFVASPGDVTRCRVDAGAFVACTSPFTTAALADGWHTFEVQAVDAAGNVATASRTFAIDTTPPAVSIHQGPTTTVYDATARFAWTSTEPATATYCRSYRQGSPGGAWSPCASPVDWAVQRPVFPEWSASWTFQVAVRDAAGNWGYATRAYQTGLWVWTF